MKKIIYLLFLFSAVNAQSQEKKIVNPDDENYVYSIVPEMPRFLGYTDSINGIFIEKGMLSLKDFIAKNTSYSTKAKENKMDGQVAVRFVVRKNGFIDDLKIVRSLNEECDKEALRVVGLMKDKTMWQPAKSNGKDVNSYFTLPVYFKL